MISFAAAGRYLILNIQFHEEEGGGWIEGEGWLSSLVPLRHDLLQQDYRLLYLVQAAAEASHPPTLASAKQLRQAIGRLPREEGDAFLLLLARGEAHLSVELNRRLQELTGSTRHGQVEPQRTVGQLLQRTQQIQVQARRKQAEEAETKRIQELEVLAPRGDQAWQEVETLIQKSQSKADDEAVQLLAKLRE